MSQKVWKYLKVLLILGSLFAAVKLIFVDYTMDEEYQIMMGYRLLQGDTLFGTMWEPHQTSGFLCAVLMRLFVAFTGSLTGVVIFLRFCATLFHFGLAIWVYRVLKDYVQEKYAFLLSVCYFNMIPKLIPIPEFSNMQIWLFTIMILAVLRFAKDFKKRWLIVCGVAMSLEVLAYPACLLLFPFLCIAVGCMGKRQGRWKDILIVVIVCAICAAIWLFTVLSKISVDEFIRNLKQILSFDATHSLNAMTESKTQLLNSGMLELLLLTVLIFLFSAGICFLIKRKVESQTVAVIAVWVAEIVQLFYWVVLREGYEKPQITIVILMLAPILVWRDSGEVRRLFLPGWIGSALAMLAVLYMSDMGIWNAIPTGILGALWGVIFLISAVNKRNTEHSNAIVYVLIISLCVLSIFGKGFIVKAGRTPTNSILGIRNVIEEGPAKGIFTHYMLGYVMNSDYEDIRANVEEGAKCLIVTNMVDAAGTTPYMFGEYEVCHFSVIDPTTYDERLLVYWNQYPEKQPEVIAVDCWYGQLMEKEDSWIMQYIENEFGYQEVVDGKYLRFYKR